MPLALSISTPARHHIIATQPRVLLGLGRQLVQYLLIYNHSLSPHRQTQNLLFLHKHIGRNDSHRAKTCLSSTVPTIQLGQADGRAYYNRHLYKGSIFPWVKKGPDTIFFRSFPTSPIYTLPPRTRRSGAQNGPPVPAKYTGTPPWSPRDADPPQSR